MKLPLALLPLLLASTLPSCANAPAAPSPEPPPEPPPEADTSRAAPETRGEGLQDWPQWRGARRDGVWRETGITQDLPDRLTPKWTVPVGSGYSGPTVADGRVYVMDRVTEPEELERIHCFAWDTGENLWTHEYAASYAGISYPAGPRCSVHVEDGLAYALGSTGHLHCLNAKTGEVVWSHDLDAKYDIDMPIWGIAASPVLESGLLIVPASAKDAYLIAFDAKSGEERWRALSDRGNYSSPIVIDHAGVRVLVALTGDRVVGVEPATGFLFWEADFTPTKMPLAPPTPVHHEDLLFFTGFYDGSLLLRLNPDELEVEEVWRRRGPNERRTDGLHSIISTPFIRGDHLYGVDSYGELRCLERATGERVWEDRTAVPWARWATIHLVQHGERTWLFNERGELILAELSPEGYRELDRGFLIKPTLEQLPRREGVCWTHPAFAYRHVFVRNDEELVCADLSASP